MHIIRFLWFYYKGLSRNFKVINYGDALSVHSAGKNVEKYNWINERTPLLVLLKLLRRELVLKSDRVIKIPAAEVLFCGGSANNEREFVFLAEALPELDLLAYSREGNISFSQYASFKKSRTERIAAFLVFFVSCLYLAKIKIGPVSVKYLVYFGKIYLRVHCSFVRSPWRPKVLVVANDHTDFPVAAAMVAKLFKCRVVYVQHAEVTTKFPPLDFDVSVLRNKKTLDTYSEIGKVRGEVFIVPRDAGSAQAIDALLCEVIGPVRVVVYLSSVFSEIGLAGCIEKLKENESVSDVSIKIHPRGSLEALAAFGVEVTAESPDFKHIAIVANSSVAIELLAAGINVYQCFVLDEIPRDYYGFVSDGVVCEVALEGLSGCFWMSKFYNAQWLSKFSRYSPAISDEWKASLPVLQKSINRFLK